jgi:hypothetical protein
MSHFSVLVIGSNIHRQLAPYNENNVLVHYEEANRVELIAKERKDIQRYKNGVYAEYLSSPEAYKAGCINQKHLKYLEEEFPLKLNWTDEQCYQEAIKYEEEEENIENGSVFSTCNPLSKWDWYVIGGRWAGKIKLKDHVDREIYPDLNFSWGWTEEEKKKCIEEKLSDQALVGDIANLKEIQSFAVLNDGIWFEKGKMGWFGVHSATSDQEKAWGENFYNNFLKNLSDDTMLTIVDCHI